MATVPVCDQFQNSLSLAFPFTITKSKQTIKDKTTITKKKQRGDITFYFYMIRNIWRFILGSCFSQEDRCAVQPPAAFNLILKILSTPLSLS